jgi:hypothetical protein
MKLMVDKEVYTIVTFIFPRANECKKIGVQIFTDQSTETRSLIHKCLITLS